MDSNHRPLDPKSSALTRLRYAPTGKTDNLGFVPSFVKAWWQSNPHDFASCTVALATTAYTIVDLPIRFGRKLDADEVKKMAAESKIDEQWRAAGILP